MNLMQPSKESGYWREAEDDEEDRRVDDYISLLKFQEVNEREGRIQVVRGNYFE